MVLPLNFAVLNSAKKESRTLVASERSMILSSAEAIRERIVAIRNDIHKYPEMGYKCSRTAAVVKSVLEEEGIFVYNEKTFADTGVVGRIGVGNRPRVALRADMDALPLQEEYDWPNKSDNPGVMHACGHDAHTAMLLGAAILLQERFQNNEFQGTVYLIFQPAEENYAGAAKMVEDGALMDAEAIFGLHVTPGLPAGTWASRAGTLMAGGSNFSAKINGLGGHGGVPQASIDPIVASAFVISSLQPIISRETDPGDSQVVTIGYVNGGTANNVIPDYVDLGGTFRYIEGDDNIVEERKRRILEVIKDQAAVHRCTASARFETDHNYPPVINTAESYQFIRSVALKVLGDENNVVELPSSATASEDFSYYLKEKPGAFYFLGCAAAFPEDNEIYPVHSPKFVLDENVLPIGVAMHAAIAMEYLANNA